MQRKKYILGNWKLNKNLSETASFFSTFNKKIIKNKKIEFGFAPTFLCLGLATNLKKGNTRIIAQDVSECEQGSYTGQIGCKQLKDYGIGYAIVGHSETRKFLGCNDTIVNKKVLTCLSNNIKPIICIGESLDQYTKKQTKKILSAQLKTIFMNVETSDAAKCIIAYEPLWAIGSGKTPSLKEISGLCGYIRNIIKQLFNTSTANKIPILYGGSVNESNALDIVTLSDVDGSLIGGTSLHPQKISKILEELDKWTKKLD